MDAAKSGRPKPRQYSTLGIVAAVMILFIFLIVFTINNYKNLKSQLFEERKLHLTEFADKVSEVIDSVVDSSWKQVDACRHIIAKDRDSFDTTQELMEVLAGTCDFIDTENSIVLAMEQEGDYFASDGSAGYWTENSMTAAGAADRQQAFVEIPHIPHRTYFLFIERLDAPVAIRETGKKLTHTAVAVYVDAIQDKMSIRGFGEQCYSYIINNDGRRLYEYTYAHNFVTGYNILRAVEEYPVVNGGTYDDLRTCMQNGESSALEFAYYDEATGETADWFAANSRIESVNWQVLLFVPTDVLGAYTNALMNETIRFFLVLAAVLVLTFCMMLFVIMRGRADKRLIAHQKETNIVLSSAVKEAESANRAKSEFLSHMSHDIRTPINGIMGMTDIAVKHLDDRERVRDCLGKIHGSSEHLMNLLNDVLNMSRIESGKTEAGHAPFDLRACMEQCAAIIEGQLVTRDVELVREFGGLKHPFVFGDELHLRQIFINILGNSVKFTPEGGKIFFRGEEVQFENGRAVFRFELADTGIGMKPEFLPHIFEPFVQEDGGARTTYKGTGLGMSITKQLTELLGGSIQVESRLNEGTKFVLEIPMDIDPEAKAEKTGEDVEVELKGMRILLVEDNELNLEIAQVILEEEGAVVTAVENGRLAVEAFENHPPGTYDAVLMDIMMPVMDGIEAAKTIRGNWSRPDAKTIPILAMTANAYDEDIKKTREAGMNTHLSKPINPDMLVRTLDRFYIRRRLHQKPDLTGKKVLLAEDNELNAEIAQEILNEEGLVVVFAENGQRAVETFLDNPPGTFDVILMDMNMPVMDGITAAKAIRASDRSDAGTVPILAMTANTFDEDVRKTKEAGMNGHLAKPLDTEKLFAALAEAVLKDSGEGL